MRQKKKPKSPYDENGNWVEEHNRLVSGLRKVFRLHPIMKEIMQAARVELPPKILKSGEVGKKNQIRYKCAACLGLFSQKNIQVDHKEPMIPLDRESRAMTLDEIWERLRCTKDNLQVLCSTKKKDLPKGQSSCHHKKSARENFIREEFKKMKDNQTSSIYSHLANASTEEKINFFSKMYDDYMVHKEEEAKAKERRKLERLSKKKSK